MPSAEERAFFDRIRDDPADDGPRLIYADWLA
ncbi:MAG: TIGR02996 domain-containing protein, partial [Zavarzinella sp.]|nr:TIGR02996 domain-containing protein [Zavarzinella sp.]